MSTFEEQAAPIAATAGRIARLKGDLKLATVLESGKARLVQTGHDDYGDGYDIYAFLIEVSVELYAEIDDDRDKLEKSILTKIEQLTRSYAHISIGEAIVSPLLLNATDSAPQGEALVTAVANTEGEVPASYWAPGHFRLFISHSSEKKESVHNLKSALAEYQIAAFVAHDDIEPTRKWQDEIETALRTMDALAAVISPNFQQSAWCDQEVGFAIGRAKLIVALQAGANPHGFLARNQGLQTRGRKVSDVSRLMFEIIIKNESTSFRLVDSLISRLALSKNWASARKTANLLANAPSITNSQAARLLTILQENTEVSGAFDVPEIIEQLVARAAPESAP